MKKILIVEDDQLVATAYKKRFHETGYEVEWAADGLEGIKMVVAMKPDVVLLDLLMPRLDGIEVLKYIRAHPELKHLPVVVFSNSYMTNLVENAWRAGADQCLMKASTTPAQLFDVVSKAIQKAAARAAAPETSPAPAAPPSIPTPRPVMSALLQPPMVTPAPSRPPGAASPSAASTPPPAAGPITPLARPAGAAIPPVTPLIKPTPGKPGTAPPLSSGSEKGTSPGGSDVDPEFQAQIRELFLSSAPAKIAAMREAANAFAMDQGSSMQMPLLADLFRKVHSLTGNAAVAGCASIAHYASTLEALLQELQQKPKFINTSTVRTILQAVEFVDLLFQHATKCVKPAAAADILVVDADAMSSQAISMALETAHYTARVTAEPAEALVRLTPDAFAAVIVAVSLPNMSGFEFCAQIQALPAYANMPVLFVTPLNDFNTHAHPEVLGNNDIIAQPFLLIELTLKAVTHVEWGRLARGAA